MFQFNVDGRLKVSQGQWSKDGYFKMIKERYWCLSLSRDSNEGEVLDILEALRIYSSSFHGSLLVESDSLNAISWVLQDDSIPWKFHYYFHEMDLCLL